MSELSMPAASGDYDETMMQHMAVDVEHLGIRMAVPLLAVAGFVSIFWLGPLALDLLGLGDTGASVILLPLAVAAAIGAAYAGDYLLKRFWPSGRYLLLGDRCLVLRDRRKPEQVVDLDERVNVLAWRFTVSRRGRVPKGFYCMALQFTQDENQITLYTFADPKKIDGLPGMDKFTVLAARKTIRDERLNMRVAGQQRRLLQAEDIRWQDGAELLVGDFRDLWQALQQHDEISYQG
jgi:hypothetical protein